jgi:PAS domain S-box-containing protein
VGTSTGPARSLAAERLLSLAVTVTSEQRVESVLQSIVQGLASQPGVALARIWLLPSVHHPSFYNAVSGPLDCLCLVASAGTPIHSPGEDWSFLQGHFARMAFNVGKVGQVAASRHAILVEDVAAQNDWIVRPEWAKREAIRSFAGHPLIFRDKLLGVIAVFSRQPLGQQEFTWLGLFANQAALAISNACAEEALHSTERNLTAIINTIPTAAWTTRPDGYCEFLNQVWLDYAGMTAEQAQGWGWAEAIHPDDRPKLVEEWQSCLASGTPVDTEARIRRFDGSYRWFLIRGNPLKDEGGNILKWYGTCVDIEDRKRREEAQRTRELSWRQIVDNIPGLVATTGAMGEVEFLNRQTLEYFGKTTEELKSWALNHAVHPDDLPHVIEARKKSIETGQIYEVEHRCRRADGVYRWFQVRGLPVRDTQNQITAWYLLLTDIDDRKRAEEALRTRELDARSLLDNMPGFLARLSPDGTPEIFNRPFLQYLARPAEETKKWKTNDVIHPDDLAHSIEVFGNAISKGQPLDIEHRLRRFDGVYRWFQVRMVPVRDVEGRILHWNALTTDIEDRKRAEAALQSSERNLSLMISAIPTYIHVLRTDGSVLYANQAVLDYFGMTLADAQKDDYRARFFHPEDVERLRDERREALQRPIPFENEQRALGKDGLYRWFLIRYSPLLDEEGKIDRWYSAAIDIEDRKRAEDRLRQSEEDLRAITDTIRQPISVLAPDGTMLYANRVALDNSGLTRDEVIKEDFIARLVHPDDVNRVRDEHRIGLLEGVPFDLESRLRFKSGQYRWQLIQYNPLKNESGQIIRWYVTVTDIDDRKRAEAQVEQAYLRLAEAQRLSKTGSFITDLVADDHDWSEEAFRIFEFDPAAKITVELIRDTIHPEDLPTFDAVMARGMTGTDVDFGFRIVTPRGAVKHLRGMARVMAQSGGRPMFIGALQDVTENKLAEEALDRARSELAHAARITTLNALTASMAHEINQPLASLVTNASISFRRLNADPPNIDGARETLQRTIRDANGVSDVITRLRALFSKRELALEPLDLNEATQEVISLLLSDLQRNRVILRPELAENLPPVIGDRVQLQQVILNLLRNASDAMNTVNDRPRELLIKTVRDEGDRVRLSVIDAGVGFSPEAATKLFQAFYTTKRDGMGIGLSLSYSIIHAHHGRLWAQPNDGPGATFAFSIPSGSENVKGATPGV